MIQRIQTVYLLIALLAQTAQLFLPWATYFHEEGAFFVNGLNTTVDGVSAIPLTVTIALSIAAVLITIMRYKDRSYQQKLAGVSMIMALLTIGGFAWVHWNNIQALKDQFGEVDMGYGFAFALPLISIILIWMARRAIKKDEDLVKSVDRLR